MTDTAQNVICVFLWFRGFSIQCIDGFCTCKRIGDLCRTTSDCCWDTMVSFGSWLKSRSKFHLQCREVRTNDNALFSNSVMAEFVQEYNHAKKLETIA